MESMTGGQKMGSGGLEGTLPRRDYLDEDRYRLEMAGVWQREWLCVGRIESVSRPGDFLHVMPTGQSILIVVTQSGAMHGFFNVCRHRGSQLVIDDELQGNTCSVDATGRFGRTIRCPYHSWTYGLEGDLRSAPFLSEDDGLSKEKLALFPVAVDTWGGFIFVHLTKNRNDPGLAAQLSRVPDELQSYPLPDLRVVRRIAYDVRANWKCIAENYNECYHCGPVHPELCEIVPAFKRSGGGELDWSAGIPHRDGASTFSFSGTTDRAPFPGLKEEEKTRHKGALVYPNLMLSLSPDHVAAFTLWPQAPDRTVVLCDFLFHPDEIARPTFDATDAVEFWDLVNQQDWRICESVQRGMNALPFRSGYYAPMEDESLDIRRYLDARLSDETEASGASRSAE